MPAHGSSSDTPARLHRSPLPWTAPEVERAGHADSLTGGERELLEGRLEWQRATLLSKCTGLTGRQLAVRAAPPSALSLLGLLRHVAQVERTWFQRGVAGLAPPRLYPAGGADFNAASADGAEADYAVLVAEMAAGRRVVDGLDLDHEYTVEMWGGSRATVRWTFVHMIEEYARHNGHADLLRERIDGTTGL